MEVSIVQPGQEGRLDAFLTSTYDFSRAKIQKIIEQGRVTVNAKEARRSSQTLVPGDTVYFNRPEESPLYPVPTPGILNKVYEDEDLLVLDKPSGIVVHPQSPEEEGTLVHTLLAEYPEMKDAVYDPENPVSRLRPGIVHRLDKNTSGLLIVAKNQATLHFLAEQFHNHTIRKVYETLLFGRLDAPRTVDAPIQRKGGGNKNQMRASHDSSQGRAARSHFTPIRVISPTKDPDEIVTLTNVEIETGRTHQIRVHAKFIGHPVMGDTLYGNKPSMKLSAKLGMETQILRAVEIEFEHPKKKERMHFSIEGNPIALLLPA